MHIYSARVKDLHSIMSNGPKGKPYKSPPYKSKIDNSSSSSSSSSSNKHNIQNQFIIQIERQGERLSMQDIHGILKGTGIQLDSGYGPYLVNPQLGRYVVRGFADSEGEQKARKLPGIMLFRDTKVRPI